MSEIRKPCGCVTVNGELTDICRPHMSNAITSTQGCEGWWSK